MRRGHIYWAHFSPRSGSEQSGKRPALIISTDGLNAVPSWNSLIVLPLSTSKSQNRSHAGAVFLKKGVANLPQDSFVLCHQITTLDRSKLEEKLGELNAEQMEEVEEALRDTLELF